MDKIKVGELAEFIGLPEEVGIFPKGYAPKNHPKGIYLIVGEDTHFLTGDRCLITELCPFISDTNDGSCIVVSIFEKCFIPIRDQKASKRITFTVKKDVKVKS